MGRTGWLLLLTLNPLLPRAIGAEQVTSVIANFEDPAAAIQVRDVRNILVADCRPERVAVPARGKGALALEIGATTAGVSLACDLVVREPQRLRQVEQLGVYCWIDDGQFKVGFRIRDASGQVFESALHDLSETRRWLKITSDLKPGHWTRVTGSGELTYPIEVLGFRITTDRLGQQRLFLDDLQVEHSVPAEEAILPRFEFDRATHLYEPDAAVGAAVVVENRSQRKPFEVSAELVWQRPDGSVLQSQRAAVSLPPSGSDFRSFRRLDFSQTLREPGLYRLVARLRAPGWTTTSTVAAAVAVTPSNRKLARGRSVFFGVRTALLHEPEPDRLLELAVARDMGANLVVLEVPWQALEPKAGNYDLRDLVPLIEALTGHDSDLAVQLALTAPPEWVASAPGTRVARLEQLIQALAGRFGERLTRFQFDASVLGRAKWEAALADTVAVAAKVHESYPRVTLLPPAVAASDVELAGGVRDAVQKHPSQPLVLVTTGAADAAIAQFEAFRAAGSIRWREIDVWRHEAGASPGAGSHADAEGVLRLAIAAARAGVGSLVWSDLRDDSEPRLEGSDSRERSAGGGGGLLQRDFSPRATLLGYAAAAGTLTGCRYVGPVAGTPDEFESALFIGGQQQVAVILPLPNRVRPALLAPVAALPGDLTLEDFERRARPILAGNAPPLFRTAAVPLFLTLRLRAPNPEPQLSFGSAWFEAPAPLFCGADRTSTLRITLPFDIKRGYVQARPPADAPFVSSLNAQALRGDEGEQVQFELELRPKPDAAFGEAELPFVVALDGTPITVPLAVQELVNVLALKPGTSVEEAAYRIARLAAADPRRTTAEATLHAAYAPGTLHVALLVQDDKFVPYSSTPDGTPGDHALLGIGVAGAPTLSVARLTWDKAQVTITPAGKSADAASAWTAKVKNAGAKQAAILVEIPLDSFGKAALSAGDLLRLSAQVVDDDADGFPPGVLKWGGGLDGSRSVEDSSWLSIAARPSK